jgi:uncharacterized protein (DUF2126 family)
MQRISETLADMANHVSDFEAALQAHDAALQASALEVWIGSEPTFTRRLSEAPEWLNEALGETKQDFAMRIVRTLRERYPSALVLRTIGRQYRDEARPRWNVGLYRRRDGAALARFLPTDPLADEVSFEPAQIDQFWRNLVTLIERSAWHVSAFETQGDMGLRVLFRIDGNRPEAIPQQDPRSARPSLHDHAIPLSGAVDDLADEGCYLAAIGQTRLPPHDMPLPCIELPAFPDVSSFMMFVGLVSEAAATSGLHQLVWRGFPPPVDDTVEWTTLTPDPAVVEINAAPSDNVTHFLEASRSLYDLAETVGLSAYRLHYNGDLSDSGGGGQFTLGGPRPERSPFFTQPQLLARLIRYLARHPALSYWFAPAYVGSFSQSPRPDENVRESFGELAVALQQLTNTHNPQPEFIWRSLSPFLVDTSGNAHRSELNIEKLWNPYLPLRGCLGLVECRAFRMPADAETAASIAALLRAITAMLSLEDVVPDLSHWGSELHDRYALPFYLRQDLTQVLADLVEAGFGLGEPIVHRLLDDAHRHIGHTEIDGCRIDVERAVEFWPLLGDAASQEGGSSRLVDASTSRVQLSLRPVGPDPANLDGWQLLVGCYRIPLRETQNDLGALRIMGLRYRSFVPWIGLHPGIGKQSPVVLTLVPPAGRAQGVRITLHEWQPQAAPYDGLPLTLEEAERRRNERFVVEPVSIDAIPEALPPPSEALTDFCLDLRRC